MESQQPEQDSAKAHPGSGAFSRLTYRASKSAITKGVNGVFGPQKAHSLFREKNVFKTEVHEERANG